MADVGHRKLELVHVHWNWHGSVSVYTEDEFGTVPKFVNGSACLHAKQNMLYSFDTIPNSSGTV